MTSMLYSHPSYLISYVSTRILEFDGLRLQLDIHKTNPPPIPPCKQKKLYLRIYKEANIDVKIS